MNARLQEYALLWRAANSHVDPSHSAIVRWGGSFIALALAGAAWGGAGGRGVLTLAWYLVCGAILLTWTWRFIPGAVKLNSPANAKLVPRMRRRLVELACLVWFAAMAGIALMALADTGSIGLWLFWIMLGTVGSALGLAGHQAGGAIITATLFGSVFLGKLPASVHALLSHPSVVALALPLYAGVIIAAMREILPEGGERHWRMLERRARILPVPGTPDPLLEELAGSHAKDWYAASLRRDSARRDSRRLVLHALGPAQHLGELLVGVALLSAVLVVLAIFTAWRTDGNTVQDIGWTFACMLLVIPAALTLRLDFLVGAYPGEQALLRLAPAMPGAAAPFNCHLGRAMLRQGVTGWALSTGAALLLTAIGGASLEKLLLLASICCLVLPLMAAPLRNHAMRARLSGVAAMLLMAASVGASIAIGFALRAVTGLPAMPVAAIASIAIAAWAITRGLRVMETSPFAFPAGRMD